MSRKSNESTDKTETMQQFDELLKLVTFKEEVSDNDDSNNDDLREANRKNMKYSGTYRDNKPTREREYDVGSGNSVDEETKNRKLVRRGKKRSKDQQKDPLGVKEESLASWHQPVQGGDTSFNFDWTLLRRKKVKLHLPKLELPSQLSKQEEEAIVDLHLELRNHGFEIYDRKTLAFFALGNVNNTPAAASYFCEFYKFANTKEVKFPDRAMMGNTVTEGAFRQDDGTLGLYFIGSNWNVESCRGVYIAREKFCYFLKMVDIAMLRAGFTFVANLDGASWRNFAPFEGALATNISVRCIPLQARQILFIKANFYAYVSLNLFLTMISTRFSNVSYVLSLDEVRSRFPRIILPPSVAATAENQKFTRLSVDEQINFKFLID